MKYSELIEEDVNEAEIRLIEHDADLAAGKPCRYCGEIDQTSVSRWEKARGK